MCDLSKGVMRKGLARGRAEGMAENTLTSIKNLMETMGWTIEQAMAALKVPEADRPKYARQLNGHGRKFCVSENRQSQEWR